MSNQALFDFIPSVEGRIRHELRSRCETFTPDFKNPEVFCVITALLARQATLAIDHISSPITWTAHSAPLFLRAMADVHISLAWILLNPETHAQLYIEYGLGQATLELERRKKQLEVEEDDELRENQEQVVQTLEKWIDAQKWHFLVTVDVGAWSGKNTRQMADEAKILDFYNYVYTPFSSCVHSTWFHVARCNSEPSGSPFTMLLRKPNIPVLQPDAKYMTLAAKYLDKTFNLFDEKVLNREPVSEIQVWIRGEIKRCFGDKSEPPQ